MNRRKFIALLGGAAATPRVARAQQRARPIIGYLSPDAPTSPTVDGLRQGLRDLGYVDGDTIQIEYRWAQGQFERLPDLAAELVRQKVDVIVAFVTQASLAAKSATTTTPIVMVGVADPVGTGLVVSLAHPGGNVTGTSSIAADIVGKQLQLLKDIVANVSRVAVLWNPANAVFQTLQLNQLKAAARTSSIELQLLEARASSDFGPAFAAIDRGGTRALLILAEPLFNIHKETLAELAIRRRLAVMSAARIFAEAGCLMSYAPDYFDLHKRAAEYVSKILKGAHPADLPVEQPTKFEFVINLKTARAIELDVPAKFLALADAVIE